MDQEIKIESVKVDCLAELKEDTFIKVETVCELKLETNESALLEDPLNVSRDAQGLFSCENEIKSEISNVNENCSKIDLDHPIKEGQEDKIPETPAELTYKQLKEIVRKGQDFTDFIKELDPNVERQSKIIKIIDDSLRCYKEEAKEKSKNVVKQTKVYNFFTKLSSKPEESVQNSNSSNSCPNSGDSGQSSSKCGPNSDAQKFHEGKQFETKVVHETKNKDLNVNKNNSKMNPLKIDRKQDLESQTVAPVHGGKKAKLDSQEGSICEIVDVVHEENNFVHEEKKFVHQEKKSVHTEKKAVHEEKKSVHEEKKSVHKNKKSVHEEKKVIPKCNICNKEFNEVEDLKMHSEVLHRGKPNPGKKPFLCNNCTSKFASKQGLKAHIFQKHVGSRQYSYWYHS